MNHHHFSNQILRTWFLLLSVVALTFTWVGASVVVDPSEDNENGNNADDDFDFSSQSPYDQNQPNILLLLTDDQDVVLGNFDHMPKVHKHLVEQGTTFENAFVHTPICCPSRASILTGRYLHNGVTVNNSISGGCNSQEWIDHFESTETYAVQAQKAGYTTVFTGKYLNQYGHQNASNVPPGWDYWFGLRGNSQYYNYSVVEASPDQPTPRVRYFHDHYETDYLPLVQQRYTLDLLRQGDNDKKKLPEPWLMVIAWPTAHGPFTPAPQHFHKFNRTRAPRTLNYNASHEYMQQKHWLLRQLNPMTNETAAQVDEIYQHRLEALVSVDEHVDALFQVIDPSKTVTIFTSDNGFQFGQHRLAIDKRHLYENDIRVPFVVRGPDIPQNYTSTEIVANIDIAPTIIELAQGTVPDSMDGISFLSHFPTSTPKRTDFLISYHGEGKDGCGMADCPIPDGLWWMPDSWNNTYHCLRTIVQEVENSMYCRFDDDENFVEYYDLTTNPWQLENQYQHLSNVQIQRYEYRLKELRRCKGPSCRTTRQ